MHIVFVDTAPLTFGGGYEHFLLGAASFGTAVGHDVTIIVPTRLAANAISFITNLTIPRASIPKAEVKTRLGRAQLVATGLRGARRAMASADVIYAKNEPQELLFALIARPRSIPLMVGFHSATKKNAGRTASLRNGLYRSGIYRKLFRSVEAVHLLHPAQEHFVTRHLFYPKSKVHLVANGIDVERFKPATNARGRVFRVLFAGRLSLQKGADLLFDTVAAVNDQQPRPAIHFTLVGDGPMRSAAEELGSTSDNVDYLGYTSDMSSVYREQDLVVVPSRWETFGLVAFEALSSGVPVALSDIDVFQELSDCHAASFADSVPASWMALIMSHYREWSDDVQGYDRRCAAAREYAAEHFDGRKLWARLFKIMQEIHTPDGALGYRSHGGTGR